MKVSVSFWLTLSIFATIVTAAVVKDKDPLPTVLEPVGNDVQVRNDTETETGTVSVPVQEPNSELSPSPTSTTLLSPPTTPETEPDDYLNWFFYHSFKKLDHFFQKEDEKEMRSISGDPNEKTNWKIRVSKVILKLVLIILALIGSILFIIGVFLFMILSFLILKFLGHTLQCCQERQKYKSNSTTYQVNV